jgi:transposase-like protein
LGLIGGTVSLARVCQQYGLKQSVVTRWKTEFLARAPQVFSGDVQRQADQERIAELERLVGRLTMELEILKKAWPLVSSAPSGNGR